MRRITIRVVMAVLSVFAFGFGLPPAALVSPGGAEAAEHGGAAGQPAGSDDLTFTYEVEQRGDVEADFGQFASAVTAALADSRGWTRAGVGFEQVEAGGDFALILASPAEVDAAHEVCSPEWSCRVGDQVLINDERWRTGTEAWTGTLAEYRQYVTNHEVGHWLGLGHFDCPGAGDSAPVMQQQSIDLAGCDPNGWPLEWEIEAVADLHGTTPGALDTEPAGDVPGVVREGEWLLRVALAGGPADAQLRHRVAGDGPLVLDWNGERLETPGMVRGRAMAPAHSPTRG